MSLSCRFLLAFSVVASLVWSTVRADDFPSRPVRIITSEPGGSNDFIARVVAQGLTAVWGKQVIVENRAGGVIPGETVMRASPDGHTLLLQAGSFWIRHLLEDKVPYDTLRDFAPLTLAAIAPNVLVVHPAVQAGSVKELIALAKSKPGALNYGSGSTGSSTHLAAELFKAMAGIAMVRIPYKATGPALTDLIGGQLQVMFPTAAVAPHVKSGKVKALAVTTARPFPLFPELPTVAASGLPGYESASYIALFAPLRTPAPLLKRLNQDMVKVLNRPEDKEKYLNSGSEVVASSPAELVATMKADIARLGKLIKEAGIRGGR